MIRRTYAAPADSIERMYLVLSMQQCGAIVQNENSLLAVWWHTSTEEQEFNRHCIRKYGKKVPLVED